MLIPKLSVTDPVQGTPLLESLNTNDLEVWRENDGTICAYGYSQADQHTMIMPGQASFVFATHAEEVMAIPTLSASREQLEDTFYRNILPMVLQVSGQEVLHASAIRIGGGVLGLCAISETGKSTIAYAFGQRGYTQWADDALVVDLSKDRVNTKPLPFCIRLRPASAAHFSYQTKRSFQQHEVTESVPLTAFCVLQRIPGEYDRPIVQTECLSTRQALPELLKHAYCFSLRDTERKRRMLQNYLRLVQEIPVFSVGFSTGLHGLDILLDTIEDAIGAHKCDCTRL